MLLWLIIVPGMAGDWLETRIQPASLMFHHPWKPEEILSLLLSLFLLLLSLWGYACVLFLGRRLIQNKAGRTRSSFRAVRREGLMLLPPLLFTSLLQGCLLFYRSLLFLIPSFLLIAFTLPPSPSSPLSVSNAWPLAFLLPLLLPALLYYLRTFFFEAAIACEGKNLRQALKRSDELTRGMLAKSIARIAILASFTLLPVSLVHAVLMIIIPASSTPVFLTLSLLENGLMACALSIFAFSTIALFGSIRTLREFPHSH